jgi:hypothetical protein
MGTLPHRSIVRQSPGERRQLSVESAILSITRHRTSSVLVAGEYFLYGFKGARSAPTPAHAAVNTGIQCAGRLVPPLGPSGHGGVGALWALAPAAQLQGPTSQRNRAAQKSAILPAIQR